MDPDGRRTYPLSDIQWNMVKIAKEQVSKNLDFLISELRNCNNDITKLDSKIINSAKTFLTSEFGSCYMDCSILAYYLEDAKNQIDKLDRKDFKYNDKKCDVFARANSFTGKITLFDLFFNAKMNKKNDSKEGTLLHEATHSIFALGTFDFTYDEDEMKNLKDDGLFPKGWNANNWEYFYEEIFN